MCSVPSSLQVSTQSDDVNCAPWSDVMVAGEPKWAIHWLTCVSIYRSMSIRRAVPLGIGVGSIVQLLEVGHPVMVMQSRCPAGFGP